MNEPESPLAEVKQCFNCGKELESNAAFCPHCGAPLPTQGSGIKLALRFIGAIILSGLALVFGLAGSWSMIVAVAMLNEADPFIDASGAAILGLMLLVMAAFCLWGVISIIKKR